jgi:hypothetical protein
MPFHPELWINHPITWQYNDTDVIDLEWSKTITTLTIMGVDETGTYPQTYPQTGRWRVNTSYYNEELFAKNAAEIRGFPLVSIDLNALFPNLKHLSLVQLNIKVLTIPQMLAGFIARDTQIQSSITLPPMLYITLNTCYGLWNNMNIPSVKRLVISGDYHDNFHIKTHTFVVKITACKISRISLAKDMFLNNLETLVFNECILPYADHIVNTRYKISRLIDNNHDYISINTKLDHIRYTNKRLDSEIITNVLVSLRNNAFIPSDPIPKPLTDGNIRAVMILGSNYPRRMMEFITYS